MADNDLPGRLRSTTEQMANRCSVDAHLWNVHSNAALEAADEIERLRAENERLKAELRLSTDIMEEILAEVLSNPLCPDRTFDAVTSVQIQGNKEALGDDRSEN